MPMFHAKNKLDQVFEVGIFLKGLDGFLETAGGLFFLFVRPETVGNWVRLLTAHELGEDPNDWIARHLVHWASTFSKGAAVFAGLYLLAHGIVKLVLVVEILREHLWAYIGLIAVTSVFIVYQIIHIVHKPTISYILLTLFDIAIVGLTLKEYGRQRERLGQRHSPSADSE